jgi:hypothetical protein
MSDVSSANALKPRAPTYLPSSPMKGAGGTFPPRQWIELGAFLEKNDPVQKQAYYDAPPATVPASALPAIENTMAHFPMRNYAHKDHQPWRIDTTSTEGDCNQWTLGIREALIEQGIPAGALRPIYAVRKFDGAPHMVLGIETDQGTYIADQLYPIPTPWQKVPYDWKARLVTGMQWERFEP